MENSHTMAIRELDLSAWHPNPLVNRVNAVPGLKTSAAFFTFLRANLVLHSAMTSATSTPRLDPTNPFASIIAPSLSPFDVFPSASSSSSDAAAAASFFDFDDDAIADDAAPLSLEVLGTRRDKVEGLRLVADSIAQMSQRASLSLVFHPICLAGLSAALAAAYRLGWLSSFDPGLSMTVSCGVFMTYLAGIRYLTAGYLSLAERLRWAWLLRADDGEEDTLLAARRNDEIVGSLVLRLEPGPSPHPLALSARRKNRSNSLRGGRGVIRAWTTSLHHRGRGVGRDLLEEAVRVTRERCGRDAEIGFAQEHANSAMLLPEMFNAQFRRDELRAAKALSDVLSDYELVKKRR